VAYLSPRPSGLDPFNYRTEGRALVLALVGLACLLLGLLRTGVVLVIGALGP
jgi:hypothetical protein